MKLLITGIHGFVGSNIVASLKDKHEIYGLDIVTPDKEGVVRTYTWDNLADGSLPDVDAIIHLAGKAHDTKNEAEAEVYFKVNTELTQKIYDYYLQSSARKFVFFSSVKAAADSVEGEMLDENITPKPIGPYGESKIKAEEYIRSKWNLTDKDTYIFRPCMIHGPGNKGNLNLLYSVIRHGIPWPLGAFDNKRSFTSVENLIYIIERLLEREVATGIYNIGDDKPLSTNELISLMCGAMGKKPRIWKMGRGLIKFIASTGTLLHLPLNKERLRKLTENYVVDNRKIKQALGIDELPVSSSEGIVRTIKSFGE